MKRLIMLGLTFLMLLLGVSCGGEEEETPYRKKSLLEYLVSYENGEFYFSKTGWDASEEEWLKTAGLTRNDVVNVPESEGSSFTTIRVKKRIYFADVACPGFLLATFNKGKLYSVYVVLMSDDKCAKEGPPLDESDTEKYPAVEDLSGVCAKLADQIKASGIPEPSEPGSLEGIGEGSGARWYTEDGLCYPLEINVERPSHADPPNWMMITVRTNTLPHVFRKSFADDLNE